MNLSVVVITKNEERVLARCLDSVKAADEVIVVDSGSTDATDSIAKSHGAKFIYRKWDSYARQKNFGIAAARGKWVLSVDADEAVTPELMCEIKEIIAGYKPGAPVGYYAPRLNIYYNNKPLRRGGLYPDHQLRFFKKGRARFRDVAVHENMEVDGATARLRNDMLHYTKPGIEAHIKAVNDYTDMEAKRYAGRVPTGYSTLLKPLTYFISRYFFKLGFLDGMAGLIYHTLSAHYVFIKEVKLLEAHGRLEWERLLRTLFVRSRTQ
ncbi:MAG: glycosyltransferase family 2 protein [Spirochaetia bacterium]|nr:glycosyltransferase family 2 protein [Spirochaetia bacterium]